jgi:cytochrome b
MNGTAPLVRVWDPLVRVGHWVLVIAFFVAYFTEDDLLGVHVWAGYVVGIILVVRLFWGFVGPHYARFSDFVRTPREVFAYLRDLILFRAPRYIGHSPGGGAMVIALLLSLTATVVTGLVLYGQEHRAGPLAPLFASNAPAQAGLVINAALADEKQEGRVREEETKDETLEEVHDFLANLTLALIIAHVLGVLLASTVHRENLIGAMITGRKRAEKTPEASS